MIERSRLWLIPSLALLTAVPAETREYAPRILSPHNADAYSMRTFADYANWKDLEGDDKVLAIYEYLGDKRTGLYPMGAGAWEGNDEMYEYGYIRDPVKMINVYPVGYCDMLGPTLAGIFEDMGVGEARTVNLPGLHHVFTEVRIGKRWAYVDLDLRGIFLRDDGTLASTEDARSDPSLWDRPTGPLFFPMNNLASLRKSYAKSPVRYRYGVQMGGATMDYVLRRGETFTRWWKPQGDRWHHHASYHERLRSVLERDPKGPKCKHGSAYTVHTRGNGRFVYRPDLTSSSPDYLDGVYSDSNVKPGPEGLTLAEAGSGYAVFEVRTPYVIVPQVEEYETTDDDRNASVVEIDAEGARLEVSVDNGITWSAVPCASGRADLTAYASGRYGYLLKLALHGEPGGAVVRSLGITTWVQVHPASLPSLRRGENSLRYVTGDHYGLQSRVIEIRPDGSDPSDLLKHLVEPPADYDPKRKTQRIRGPFVARVKAPPRTRIAWFSAGGNFCTHQGEAATRTDNSMAWAAGKPEGFQEFYSSGIPGDQSHWHTNADVEVRLEEPAREVFIRYVGDPAVNNIRIYAHCIEEQTRPGTDVIITHVWTEGGQARRRQVQLEGPGTYNIVCEEEPTDESLELAVPGGPGT
jgi:hypothetical protein